MLKLITFPGEDDFNNVFVEKISPQSSLTKTAAELHPEIQKFIGNIKEDPNTVHVLINALGSGEYYGSNVNGDYFEEDQLLGGTSKYADLNVYSDPFGYKTFLDGGVYRHHKNKDINKSMGKVAVSIYNPRMRRVELIVSIDRQKAQDLGHGDLVRILDEGGHPAVSMGCKVKYDVCMYCGHKSKTRADYCTHARNMMGKIMPNGVKVAVANPRPRFFDISFVIIGADKTSYAMSKLASAAVKLSADAAAEAKLRDPDLGKVKGAKQSKVSEMLKKVPMTAEKIVPKAVKKELIMPRIILKQAAQLPLEESLTTFSSMGIVLMPEEFQHIVLTKLGKGLLADRLYSSGKVFRPTEDIDRSVSFGSSGEFSEKLASAASSYIGNRSVFEPFISKRVLTSSDITSNIPDRSFTDSITLRKISEAYNGYRVGLLEGIVDITSQITLKQPILKTALSNSSFEDEFIFGSKSASLARGVAMPLLGILPLAHLYGAYARDKKRSGKELTKVESFVEKHPNFTASMGLGLVRLGIALKKGGFGTDAASFTTTLWKKLSS